MGCRGVYFALSDADSQLLLATHSDEEAVSVIEDIEERCDENWLVETDKAWDAIHRCLTDGTLKTKGTTVRAKCVIGGRQLYREDDYIISYVTPSEVKAVAHALEPINKPWFRNKYYGLQKRVLWFTFSQYDGPIDEEDFEYSWEYFEAIRTFYQKVAVENRAIVFTVDQ